VRGGGNTYFLSSSPEQAGTGRLLLYVVCSCSIMWEDDSTIPPGSKQVTRLKILVLRPTVKLRRAGLFDSAVIAAAFKTTVETDDNTGEWTVVKPANPYGTKREKNELAIAALPGDFQIYRFTIPQKQNGNYKDFPDFDEIQAITALMELTTDIRETQLVGKQEWMQQWDSTHERLNLGKIEGPYSLDVRTNYFQNVTEKTKYGEKDHWRMAIAGIPEKEVEGYIAEVKTRLRAANLSVYFELHEFTEMIEYDVGWLSGMDADVLQKSAVTEGIKFAFQAFDNKFLKFAPGEEGADNLPKFVLKTKRYTAVMNGATRASAPVVIVASNKRTSPEFDDSSRYYMIST
jgi:hypothetical protein